MLRRVGRIANPSRDGSVRIIVSAQPSASRIAPVYRSRLYAQGLDIGQTVVIESTYVYSLVRLELTFGVLFFDYDLDGRLDLLSANGHLEEEIGRVQAGVTYRQAARLSWNAGPEHASEFVSVSPNQCGQDLFTPLVGRGSAYADIDGDGDLDVLLTQVAGQPLLLRNEVSDNSHYLRFKLIGA